MTPRFPSLQGKRVLITGSSRGIGRALALGFAKNGANVAFHGVKESQALEEAVALATAEGVQATSVLGDLLDSTVPEKLVTETVQKLGGLDILICNASVQIRKPWLMLNEEDMLIQAKTNFFSTVKLMQAAVPQMQKNGWGRLITIGSVQQSKPHPDMLIYSAIKCAVRNVVQSLAQQLAEHSITVNNVAVGTIYTDRNTAALSDDAYHEKVKNDIPLKYIGTPEDIVGGVLLLASEEGRYITGEDLHIDGGKFM